MKENIIKLWELINNSKKILLINHIRMDGDAFWSLIAFYKVLEKLWKIIKATNNEKSPDAFNFLWNKDIIVHNLDIEKFSPDLIIALDAWWEEQLWEIYQKNIKLFKEKEFVVIDHHITNKWYWKLNIIDTNASSTCELIFEILEKLELVKYIYKEIATLLITWIITDTNIYYNSNTTSKTLEIASKLVRLWADYRSPIFHLFRKKEFNKSKLWWEILKNIKSTPNKKIVRVIVKDEYFEKTNTIRKDLTWLINEFLANIEWNEVSFLLYSLENWKIKASFRSQWIDISKICSKFWWWWHKQAAGFISDKNIETVEKMILEKLKNI
jgi:phosphoesterase RecJ-like protein